MATSDEHQSDPVPDTGGRNETRLVPPQLPPFLAATFDLKPIVGAPNNQEVKLVHATMRVLSSFLSSELRESVVDLSMELSQHLFDVQMACYREKYGVGIFPNDIVYTPPSLPPHIPIKLEPVVGPPSDDELQFVHAALRVSDSLLSVPSIPHLDLNMQLSQHLFDLQLARHVQRSIQSHSPATRPSSQRHNRTSSALPGQATTKPDEIINTNTSGYNDPVASGSGDPQNPDTARQSQLSTAQGFEERHGLEEDRAVLIEISETLKNMNRVMIGSQHSLARGFNSVTSFNGHCFDLGTHSLINEKGEIPELPGLVNNRSANQWRPALGLNVALLPQYLRFYGIGAEMLEEGEEPKIKPGMEGAAKALVLKHVHTPLV